MEKLLVNENKTTLAGTEVANIKVAGYHVKVQLHPNLLDDYGRYGEYSPTSQIIRLDQGLTRQQMQETLIHELLEAINSIYDLNLEHDNQLCKLSVVIHQIINDNEQLMTIWA